MREAAEEARRQDVLRRRLTGLGLEVRPFPDGPGMVVTLPLGPERFELPGGGSARFSRVSFATVGADRIKCLDPLPFFHLGLIRVGGCSDPPEFEARIRAAWRARLLDLLRTRNWLEKLGLEVVPEEDDTPVLAFPLQGERDARVRLVEPGVTILPARGPLRGLRLARPEDRTFRPDPSLGSGVDVELAVATRLDELARMGARLARSRRPPPTDFSLRRGRAPERCPRILVVGPDIGADRRLLEALRLHGFAPLAARSEPEARRVLDRATPELVLAETDLGRFEGVELIPELRTLPGIEEIPVVLVDAAADAERKETARRAGAAGYLVRPFEVGRIHRGLRRLVTSPARRRYTRYQCRLSAQPSGLAGPDIITHVGRGGALLWTDRPLETESVDRWQIAIPELGASLEAEAEVLYASTHPGSGKRGFGLRFRGFAEGDETLWIRFIKGLRAG